MSRILVGHTKLTHRHLMSRNNQQPACKNVQPDIDNQKFPPGVSPMERQQKKIKYPEQYKKLTGKDWTGKDNEVS